MAPGFLGVMYCFTLLYLFLGISIVADIFMQAIEKITSQKRTIFIRDENDELIPKKVSVWNPTVANLTLMAIGSSSPEILLTIIETCQTLDKPNPGQLGYANIVGSASFNFLVVTAFAVFAVSAKNDKRNAEDAAEDGTALGVKRVNEMSVYTITIIWSIVAYGWLYFVLSDKVVMIWEAAVTLAMFFVMLLMCWAADRINARRRKKRIDQKGGVLEEVVNLEAGAT